MPVRLDPSHVGQRTAHRLSLEIADELRRARISSGLTQRAVAAAIGVRRMRVSEIERAKAARLTLDQVARQAAAVGLRLSVKLYPVGGAVRDAAQIRYSTMFLGRIGRAWSATIEAPIPIPGDLRAIDVLLGGPCVIAVEIITRLGDIQAQVRAAQLKQRDMGATRLILVVAGTHANRRALAEARHVLATSFDLDTQRTMSQLRAGLDPGRDAIVVIG